MKDYARLHEEVVDICLHPKAPNIIITKMIPESPQVMQQQYT